MKYKKAYHEMSDGQLLKLHKVTTGLTSALGGALFILLMAAAFFTITRGFALMLAIPICLLPVLVLNFNSISALNKELIKRKLNHSRQMLP